MKNKRPYIAPDITTIEMERENIMDDPKSWVIRDKDGNIVDQGHVIEGMPDDAKEASPFSGDWEL